MKRILITLTMGMLLCGCIDSDTNKTAVEITGIIVEKTDTEYYIEDYNGSEYCITTNDEKFQPGQRVHIVREMHEEKECTKDDSKVSSEWSEFSYRKLSQESAYRIIESNPNAVILDVRRISKYNQEHIKGAVHLVDTEIEEKINELIPEKGTVVLVYCRTGNRSKDATELISRLGYLNVYDIGGIEDWTYETETAFRRLLFR